MRYVHSSQIILISTASKTRFLLSLSLSLTTSVLPLDALSRVCRLGKVEIWTAAAACVGQLDVFVRYLTASSPTDTE